MKSHTQSPFNARAAAQSSRGGGPHAPLGERLASSPSRATNVPRAWPAWAFPARANWRILLGPAVLVALGMCAFQLDAPLASWLLAGNCPKPLMVVSDVTESFGHGIGIAIIVAAIALVDARGPRYAPRLLIAAWGGGMLANLGKILVERPRPYRWAELGSPPILESFGEWLPLARNGSPLQSFPSAHSACAIAFALTLASIYPRGRWLFISVAALVAMQRVIHGMHFASDVLVGAAIGWATVVACRYGHLGMLLRYIEGDFLPGVDRPRAALRQTP